ncbi:MAG TPA: hypothetical protein VNA14_08465 [Mycobacteriales bacterium]|nr:hypothetical protein [Mycobacteriales bacterium]
MPLVALAAAVVVALGSSSAAAVYRTARRTPPVAALATTSTAPSASATTAALADAALSTGPTATHDVTHAAHASSASAVLGPSPETTELRVTLHVRQRTVAVGQLVEADLAVDDADGLPAEYVLDWGDRPASPNHPGALCGAGAAARTARPTHWTNRVEYSYRLAGTYVVSYRMRTLGCATAITEERRAEVVVTVLAGPLPTNGGRRPQGFVSMTNRDATVRGAVVEVQAQDLDGWVTQMIVDFGDGRAARLVENPQRCVARRGEWPSTPYFAHRYDAPYQVVGSYVVTLTVFTAGCDGRNVQQTTVRQKVVVPQSVA